MEEEEEELVSDDESEKYLHKNIFRNIFLIF